MFLSHSIKKKNVKGVKSNTCSSAPNRRKEAAIASKKKMAEKREKNLAEKREKKLRNLLPNLVDDKRKRKIETTSWDIKEMYTAFKATDEDFAKKLYSLWWDYVNAFDDLTEATSTPSKNTPNSPKDSGENLKCARCLRWFPPPDLDTHYCPNATGED
jgi:hypothetical protein